MPLSWSRINMRPYFGAASYGLVPPPEDVPPLKLLLGEVPPPPPSPPGSERLPPLVAGVDPVAVCVAGELVAGELSARRCVAVSPGSNMFPDLRTSRDVCGVSVGSASNFGISGVRVGAGGGVNCSLLGASVKADAVRPAGAGGGVNCSLLGASVKADAVRPAGAGYGVNC
jgi:hypothetical protein